MGAEDLPKDLTPFITRITQDHISGGGFGDVWKCNYNANGTSAVVAVKAFRYPEQYYDSEKINKKINREIGILIILSHDNIVPLLGTATGFGRKPKLLSLVTPWIPNGTLNVYLASKHNDLAMLDRSRMLGDVSAGLRYLHSVPVVHGDITGANILIDEGGRAKLIDFGLSTVVLPLLGQSHLAATSIHPGAIPYAAPELLSDDVGDLPLEKTDIYSFGCVMLQILSGRHPWSEVTSQNPELRIYGLICRGHSPQRPTSHPAIMDSDWDIIQKCLQFKFELRPSADEVFDLVMRRVFSSDSSSPPNGPPDDTSLNTDPGPSLQNLSTGPVTPFSTDSFRSTSSLGHEQRRSAPPPPLSPSASSNHKVRALLLETHYRKESLPIEYRRCTHGKEMLSYSAKLAQGKVLSSTQSHKSSSRKHPMTHMDALLPLNTTH
ncbi:kinase-like domain-containing protein [Suillus subluteus]|nr:kinase-like domain-containing protein [Suillus subluteus]